MGIVAMGIVAMKNRLAVVAVQFVQSIDCCLKLFDYSSFGFRIQVPFGFRIPRPVPEPVRGQ